MPEISMHYRARAPRAQTFHKIPLAFGSGFETRSRSNWDAPCSQSCDTMLVERSLHPASRRSQPTHPRAPWFIAGQAVLGASVWMAGCPPPAEDPPSWQHEAIDLGVEDDLLALHLDVRPDRDPMIYILGADGLALRVTNGTVSERRLADVDLHGVTVSDEGFVFAVGDQGVILGSDDQGMTWTRLESGTTASLTAVTVIHSYRGEYVVAAGDDIVLVRSAVTGRWQPVPLPDGGWGSLLAFGSLAGQTAALGRYGAVYLAEDPRDSWVSEKTAVSADILAAGTVHVEVTVATTMGTTTEYHYADIVVGTSGTMQVRRSQDAGPATYEPIATGVEADFVALAGNFLLASDGRIFDAGKLAFEGDRVVLGEAAIEARAMLPDFQGLTNAGIDNVVVVGDGGQAVRFEITEP